MAKDARAVIHITQRGLATLFYVPPGPGVAFVPLGDLETRGHLELLVYNTTFASPTPALRGAILDQHWTFYQGESWPVHVITRDGRAYFVQHILQSTGGGVDLLPVDLRGTDFSLTISYEKGLRGAADYSEIPDGCRA
jgi:hypothetical protein